MAHATHIPAEYASGAAGATHRHKPRDRAPSFQQVLARAQWHAASHAAPVVRATARVPVPAPGALPANAEAALTEAMARENVPDTWRAGLRTIMAHESGGVVDARNPVHSARGLYQLTRANWHLNPRGAASFGNAVEEAQGGIRYIRARYGSADQAVAFWQRHHWY